MLVDVLANVNPTRRMQACWVACSLIFISVYIQGLRLGCMISIPCVKRRVWLYAGVGLTDHRYVTPYLQLRIGESYRMERNMLSGYQRHGLGMIAFFYSLLIYRRTDKPFGVRRRLLDDWRLQAYNDSLSSCVGNDLP